jgi:putative transposase
MAKDWKAERSGKEIIKLSKEDIMKEISEVDRLLAEIDAESVAKLEKEHYTEPQPIVCKWCGSTDVMKYGIRNGVQNYICRKCKRKFTAKDTPYHMQTPTEQIGAALNMFYDGLSLSAIARHLEETYKNPVNPSTVYRWILRYTTEAIRILDPLTPKVSNAWVVDETVIKVAGYKVWFWDIIDADTRFLLASHLSRGRTILDVSIVMQRAWKKADTAPRFIISDAMPAYTDGIERVFGADALHIQTKGITHEINTNIIERFHGTVKDRTKVLRGFKTPQTAKLILNGFLIHYNFFRPHMTLRHKTPAEMAGIRSPFKNWTDVVRKQG